MDEKIKDSSEIELLAPMAPVPVPVSEGEMTQDQLIDSIDLFLNRTFQVGELLPWKGCKFEVVGIRAGMVGLRLKQTIRRYPKPRKGNGFSKDTRYDRKKKRKLIEAQKAKELS